MTASAPSGSTVLLVASIKSDQIDPKYDLGLPAGAPVLLCLDVWRVHRPVASRPVVG
jgi:hypothetical protein